VKIFTNCFTDESDFRFLTNTPKSFVFRRLTDQIIFVLFGKNPFLPRSLLQAAVIQDDPPEEEKMKNLNGNSRWFYVCGAVFAIILTVLEGNAQTTVKLDDLVTEIGHTEYTPDTKLKGAKYYDVTSNNQSIVKVRDFGNGQIQIQAVGQGDTDITFFDTVSRTQYVQKIHVQQPNSGGNSGYDKTRIQIKEVIMLPNVTHNESSPGNAPHDIHSVTSSNQSVAEARIEGGGRDSIQIYSRRLGDTWINFDDSGLRYQVHVWVRDHLDVPPPRPDPDPINKPGPKPSPKPHPLPSPGTKGPGYGRMDPCLTGTWVTESLRNTFTHWDNGGEGIVLSIKADGRVTVDYENMRPNVDPTGRKQVVKGSGEGSISTDGSNGLRVDREGKSSITTTFTFTNGAPPHNGTLSGLGLILQSPVSYTYTCSGDNLTFRSGVFTSTLRKQKQ